MQTTLNDVSENLDLDAPGRGFVSERTLRDFVDAGSVGHAAVVAATGGGVGIAAYCGAPDRGVWRTLGTSRRVVRRFASIDTAAALLKDMGISRFLVDVTSLERGRVRAPRPDRSVALRRTRTRPRQANLQL